MDGLTTIMIIWFMWFPMYIRGTIGRLSSISASSYHLGSTEKYILFTGWLFGLAVLSVFQAALDPSMTIPFGLMAVGFAVTAPTVDHRRDPNSGEDEWHTFGTILAIGSGSLGLLFVYGMWEPFVAGLVGTALLWKVTSDWIWYSEIFWTLVIGIGLFMR